LVYLEVLGDLLNGPPRFAEVTEFQRIIASIHIFYVGQPNASLTACRSGFFILWKKFLRMVIDAGNQSGCRRVPMERGIIMNGYLLADGFDLDATGIVESVQKWEEGPDGKRVRSQAQETNEAGLPLWQVHVSWLGQEWGREVEKSATVTVPSATKPQVKRHRPIRFKNLVYSPSVRVNNGRGVLVDRFAADVFSQAQGGSPNGG
jgi:hypothetical protein